MRHLMEASKTAMTWLTLLCRSLVITAFDSKDRRTERVPVKGHGTVSNSVVSVSCRSIKRLIIYRCCITRIFCLSVCVCLSFCALACVCACVRVCNICMYVYSAICLRYVSLLLCLQICCSVSQCGGVLLCLFVTN